MTGALDRHGQLALVAGAGASDTARQNLGALGNEPAKSRNVFVIDGFYFIHAEIAHLFAAVSALSVVTFHGIRSSF